jgi:acyl-CoA synthetase (NDP forming)
MTASLRQVFESRSIAVVGASKDPSKAGHQVLRSLVTAGYMGKVYPVNPNENEILGLPCYSSIAAIADVCRAGRSLR